MYGMGSQGNWQSNPAQHRQAIHEGKRYPCRDCDYQAKGSLIQHQLSIRKEKKWDYYTHLERVICGIAHIKKSEQNCSCSAKQCA